MPVNPTLPTDGGSAGAWGGLLNTALTTLKDFVNGLETTLSGKAAAVHAHAEGDVTGLVTDLAALASSLVGKVGTGRQVVSGTGLTGGGDLSTDRTLAVVYGTAAGTAAVGNDTRLSDARTPLTHAHTAGDITSGTLPLTRGGTGGTSASTARTALGLGGSAVLDVGTAAGTVAAGDDSRITLPGLGADIYRVSTSGADTGTNQRTMVGYDTTRRSDTGYTVSLGAGTITVPAAGWYVLEAHAKFSTTIATFAYLTITDGTKSLCRGSEGNATWAELSVSGFSYLAAGTVISATVYTSSVSASLVGDADGSLYYLRVVRL